MEGVNFRLSDQGGHFGDRPPEGKTTEINGNGGPEWPPQKKTNMTMENPPWMSRCIEPIDGNFPM